MDLSSALAPELRHALHRAANRSSLLVALDFDGTMSPLVDRPEDARPLPQSALVFANLAKLTGVTTALISGRDLRSLESVYPAPRPEVLIGSHGAERVVPERLHAAARYIELTEEQSALLTAVTELLGEISDDFTGTTLEYKPASTVLHVRQAPLEIGIEALAEAQTRLAKTPGLRLLPGKAVLEVSVLSATKGQALDWLRSTVGAEAMIFVGDDVTDEDGFKVLGEGDLGIKVGKGPTAATYRIDSPLQLPQLLEFLYSARG